MSSLLSEFRKFVLYICKETCYGTVLNKTVKKNKRISCTLKNKDPDQEADPDPKNITVLMDTGKKHATVSYPHPQLT
jgi:hypothetical protein